MVVFFLGRIVRRAIACAGILVLTASCSQQGAVSEEAQTPESAVDLPALLESAASPGSAAAAFEGRDLPEDDPIWPVYTFLVGEIEYGRGNSGQARRRYRELAEWAVSDPYGDGWGGSSLCGLALWRWLTILKADSPVDPEEAAQALELASKLSETRFYLRLVQAGGFLQALPQLDEATTRLLAHVAFLNGKKEEAQRYFLEYLTLTTAAKLEGLDRQLQQEVIDSGLVTLERMDLFRGKRLRALNRLAEASEHLQAAFDSQVPAVAAEAGYYLAEIRRGRSERIELLTSILPFIADPDLRQRVLLLRARAFNQDDRLRDVEQFKSDLETLIEDHPRGRWADNALYQLAANAQNDGQLDEALAYYARLRDFEGPNDYSDSAAYRPAIALIGRGSAEDLAQADRLLKEYLQRYPAGYFRRRSLFWLGRNAEQRNDLETAKSYFGKLADENRYDYYGLRALMHLNAGREASRHALPDDPETNSQLREAFRASRIEENIVEGTPYHRRLKTAIAQGIYSRGLEGVAALRKQRPSKRLEDLALSEVDQLGLVPSLALLLALRQDIWAASDTADSAAGRLRLSGAVGKAGDWPAAIGLTEVSATEPEGVRREIKNDSRYLATAYPPVYLDLIAGACDSFGVSRAMAYAVIRNESRFYPSALSSAGAMGLVQFYPKSFKRLNAQWGLLARENVSDMGTYLFDPRLNLRLWAEWIAERVIKRQTNAGRYPEAYRQMVRDNSVVLILADHQAGAGDLKKWMESWAYKGKSNDIEYFIESAVLYSETRNFIRRVLADMSIVEAAGLAEGAAR